MPRAKQALEEVRQVLVDGADNGARATEGDRRPAPGQGTRNQARVRRPAGASQEPTSKASAGETPAAKAGGETAKAGTKGAGERQVPEGAGAGASAKRGASATLKAGVEGRKAASKAAKATAGRAAPAAKASSGPAHAKAAPEERHARDAHTKAPAAKAEAAAEVSSEQVPQDAEQVAQGEAVHAHRRRAPKKEPVPQAPPGPREDEGADRAQFLQRQRELLVAERNNYTRQAEELRAQADALALEHEPGDVQFDEEGGEGGTANVDREIDLQLSAQARAAIEEIDAALAKIEAGTYGLCESCGTPIPEARLEALPQARLCVRCKSGGLAARRH